jgi:hypothetical protein
MTLIRIVIHKERIAIMGPTEGVGANRRGT